MNSVCHEKGYVHVQAFEQRRKLRLRRMSRSRIPVAGVTGRLDGNQQPSDGYAVASRSERVRRRTSGSKLSNLAGGHKLASEPPIE